MGYKSIKNLHKGVDFKSCLFDFFGAIIICGLLDIRWTNHLVFIDWKNPGKYSSRSRMWVMKSRLKILMLEDERDDAELISRSMIKSGCERSVINYWKILKKGKAVRVIVYVASLTGIPFDYLKRQPVKYSF